MKKWWMFVGVLVLLALALVVVWTTSIDYAIERAIEQYGSEALGTSVSVGSVTIRTTQGKGTIRNLRIAQPDGYGFGNVVSFDEITLDFDVDSLISGDPYRIELVRVTAPAIVYSISKDGKSNVAALQANLERYSASGEANETPGGEPSDVRIRIDRLEIERGSVAADLSGFGLGQTTAKWPSMHLQNVGGAKGDPPGELATTVGVRFMSHTLSAVANSAIGSSLDQVFRHGSKAVKGLIDRLRAP